jgi:clan AA aspartic protease
MCYNILMERGMNMGLVHAEISLKNVKDVIKAEEGLVSEQAIHQATVTALVDTGAITLVINEKLRLQLGLGIQGERQVTLANTAKEMVKIADPVKIQWKNRDMICRPLVISGDGKILLGAIPLEEMDLMVDPARNELTGIHGDEIVSYLL